MIQLNVRNTRQLNEFNRAFFPDNAVGAEKERVSKEIDSLKRQLLEKMDQLHRLARQPAAILFSADSMLKFFSRHPSMSISYSGDLRLISTNQCVAFHTMRECNPEGRNDDIIYVTFPLYAFTLQFEDNGNIVGKRAPFVYREHFAEIPGVTVGEGSVYGHPHVTMSSNSAMFGSVCQGNNRFMHEYSNMCRNGKRCNGNELLRIFWQAAVWLETANLNDMYDTPLSVNFRLPDDIRDAEFINALFDAVQEPLTTNRLGDCITAKGDTRLGRSLLHVYEHYYSGGCHHTTVHPVLFHCAWALWLWLHWEDISNCNAGLSRHSLYSAICADICVLLHPELIDFFIHHDEVLRTHETVMRAPMELSTYRPSRSSENTIASRLPCLHARNMEEIITDYYGASSAGVETASTAAA